MGYTEAVGKQWVAVDKMVFLSTKIFPISRFGRVESYISAAGLGLASHEVSFDELTTFIKDHRGSLSIPSHVFERTDFEKIAEWVLKHDHPDLSFQISSPRELEKNIDKVKFLWDRGLSVDIFFQCQLDLKRTLHLLKFCDIPMSRAPGRWIYLVNKLYQFGKDFAELELEGRPIFLSFLPSEDIKGIYLTADEVLLELENLKENPYFETEKVNILILEEHEEIFHRKNNSNKILLELESAEQKGLIFNGGLESVSALHRLKKLHLTFVLYVFRDILRIFLTPTIYFRRRYFQLKNVFYIVRGTCRKYFQPWRVYHGLRNVWFRYLNPIRIYHRIVVFFWRPYVLANVFYRIRHICIHAMMRLRHGCLLMKMRIRVGGNLLIARVTHSFLLFYYIIFTMIRLPWSSRHRIFFPFYKVYWILEARVAKKNEKHE